MARSAISSHREGTVEDVSRLAQRYSIDYIRELIRNNFEDKKDAKQNAGQLVFTRLTGSVERGLRVRVREMGNVLQEFVESLDKFFPPVSAGRAHRTTDWRARAFGAAGGASAAAAGAWALGAWAATFGNLGGYILVAKAVSVLSSLGISVGGTGAATAFVAAIGGPVTLVAVGVGAAALTTFTLVRGSWDKALAKDIEKKVVKGVLLGERDGQSILKGLDDYWVSVEASFEEAAIAAKKAYADAIQEGPAPDPAMKLRGEMLRAGIDWLNENQYPAPTMEKE